MLGALMGHGMKVLVLCEAYPNEVGSKALAFVHVRNRHYIEHGIEVVVLSFAAKGSYDLDGVSVVSPSGFSAMRNKGDFDVLICHAPNIRHHLRFLSKYGALYPDKVFFFHGHEIRHLVTSYGEPYLFERKNAAGRVFQELYDRIKLLAWRRYFLNKGRYDKLVFVSGCLKSEFCHNTGISPAAIAGRSFIIPNCVGKEFEERSYDCSGQRQFDFITIRNNLDASNYCVDLVNELANANKDLTFLVVGRGVFFEYYEKAANIEWMDAALSHKEMADLLQISRCALMPTRVDAQGLAMCEMATFGIPLISSDIEVCHEVLSCFPRVCLLDNDNASECNLRECLLKLEAIPYSNKVRNYCFEETVQKEIKLLESMSC